MTGFKHLVHCVMVLAAVLVCGCEDPWNSPRPLADYKSNTLYSSFSGRSPKTLDPQVSYSSDETIYTYSVYDLLYRYHYLKRPYEIVPGTAENISVPEYLDENGRVLSPDAAPGEVVWSRYRIKIRHGILFAPHPAFARDVSGQYLYHSMGRDLAAGLSSPLDLPGRGTRELTAEDYVYGIKRMASPRISCPVLSLMSVYLPGLGKLAAELADAEKAAAAAGRRPAWLDLRKYRLEGVSAPDSHTLEITIRGKYPQFAYWLAMTFFAPVPWEAEAFYASPGLAENNITLASWPVGTGPFMLVVSRQNREHILERNPNYRGIPYPCEGMPEDERNGFLADCGKPTPFIDRIVMTMEKEAVPTQTKFLQGYYDSPQVTRLDVGQSFIVAAGDSPDKARLYAQRRLRFPTAVEASISYIGFNWLDPVVGAGRNAEEHERNRKLRQAISIAIDWEEQVAIFEKGQGQPASGPLPPGIFGYRVDGPAAFNPVVYRRTASGRVERRPIEDAKRLMREAGYPDGRDARTGKPLVLNFDWQNSSAGSRSFLDWLSRQFSKIGIQLEIRATDYNRFQDKMLNGTAQIYYWGWLADYPDAENFLFLLYGPNSKAGSGSGGENAGNYANPAYDRLFEKMKYLEDGPQKADIIDEMISILQEDAPMSFGYFPTSAAALHNWVGNAKPTMIIRSNMQYMKINAVERVSSIRAWNRPVVWPLVFGLAVAAAFVLLVMRHVRRSAGRNAFGRAGRM